MQLDIRHLNLPVSDALREFTRRRVERALRPYQENVFRVDVRTKDVNGPRGGVDTRCTVTVELTAAKQKIVVRNKSVDAYAAIQGACARINEALSRALGRQRRLDRFGAPAPAAASPRGERASEAERETEGMGTTGGEASMIVTTTDRDRLGELIPTWAKSGDRDAAEMLANELAGAEVLPPECISRSVMTMNSRGVLRDEESGATREVLLVYPKDSDPQHGRVCILAPVGSALLGLSIGQTIDWPLPGGQLRRYRLVDIVHQPEEVSRRDS
jgi:regulator of nucleoside diphosphate kinase